MWPDEAIGDKDCGESPSGDNGRGIPQPSLERYRVLNGRRRMPIRLLHGPAPPPRSRKLRARAPRSTPASARNAAPAASALEPSAVPLRSRGHRPGLEQVELAALEGPLHIKRMTEMSLELQADLGQLGELSVVQDASATLFRGERVLSHPASRVCAHGHLLDGDTRHLDDAIPAHHVVVRRSE